MTFAKKMAMLVTLGLVAATARADQMQEFTLTAMSGPFEAHPGGMLQASMWIDVTSGAVSSMTVNFTDFTGTYSSSLLNPLDMGGGAIEISSLGLPNLELWLPVSSLKGYQGGAICTAFAPCGAGLNRASFVTVPGGEGYLASRAIVSGTVTASAVTATTPEPSSLVLFATGLAGALGIGRRRIWKG